MSGRYIDEYVTYLDFLQHTSKSVVIYICTSYTCQDKSQKGIKKYAWNYYTNRCAQRTNRSIGLSDDYKESSAKGKKYNEAYNFWLIHTALIS